MVRQRKIAVPTTTPSGAIYGRLVAEFEHVHTDDRGGVKLTYITGGQVNSRLNDVMGPFGWKFCVLEHGVNEEANEIWVRGRMELRDPDSGEWVAHEQFGSQKIKRRKQDQAILDIGFDLKGATTDCLKKCASLFGVGLYLSKDADGSPLPDDGEVPVADTAPRRQTTAPKTTTAPDPAAGTRPGAPDPLEREAELQAWMNNEDPTPAPAPTNGHTAKTTDLQTARAEAAKILGRGYKKPSATDKKNCYANLSHLKVTREMLHQRLGLDPEVQHLDEWLELAKTDIGGLVRLVHLRVETGGKLEIPTYGELHGLKAQANR